MFSIIMPAYNEEKYIAEAIGSILNQSFEDIELIVVDDGSTDKTWEIIKRLSLADSRLRVFSPGKLGKNGAINFASTKMRGDWFSFFGADDIMEPGILKEWSNLTKRYDPYNEEIVIASRIKMFANSSDYNNFSGIEIPKNKKEVCKSGAAFLATRKVMRNMFPLPEDFPNEDGWMSLYFKYLVDEFVPCPQICINYRIHDNNSLNKKADFKIFNEQLHRRSVVKKVFVDTFKKRLKDYQKKEIIAAYDGEMKRYNGDIIGILGVHDISVINKIRLIALSNKYLYKLKLIFNKFLLGRA